MDTEIGDERSARGRSTAALLSSSDNVQLQVEVEESTGEAVPMEEVCCNLWQFTHWDYVAMIRCMGRHCRNIQAIRVFSYNFVVFPSCYMFIVVSDLTPANHH